MYIHTYVYMYIWFYVTQHLRRLICTVWFYGFTYMYGPRSVPQKGNFVKQFTQQKSAVKMKTFSASCLCENVFIIFSLDFFQKIWYNKV